MSTFFATRPETQPTCRPCDIPHCEEKEIPTMMFDDTNITCITCKKFHCSKCTEEIWSGTWNGETFYKPKILIAGMTHQVWRCAFCRASFDRIKHDN
jgi:hypothetical protein